MLPLNYETLTETLHSYPVEKIQKICDLYYEMYICEEYKERSYNMDKVMYYKKCYQFCKNYINSLGG